MTSLHAARAATHKSQNKTSFHGKTQATGPKYTLGNTVDIDDQFREDNGFGEERQDVDDEVDDSVKEDMKKLEDSFRGISDRFRLVDRIGEGNFFIPPARDLFLF